MKVANDEANSVLNVDLASERKMLEGRKEGEASKVSKINKTAVSCRMLVGDEYNLILRLCLSETNTSRVFVFFSRSISLCFSLQGRVI